MSTHEGAMKWPAEVPAFEQIQRLAQMLVKAIVGSNSVDGVEAQDVASEVAARALDSYTPGTQASVEWVKSIARNIIIDLLRKHGRRIGDTSMDDVAGQRDVACDDLTPEELAIMQEDVQTVLGAVAGLDPRQRRIVQLKFFDDCQLQEIADAVGVSVSTVERELRNSIRHMGMTLGASGKRGRMAAVAIAGGFKPGPLSGEPAASAELAPDSATLQASGAKSSAQGVQGIVSKGLASKGLGALLWKVAAAGALTMGIVAATASSNSGASAQDDGATRLADGASMTNSAVSTDALGPSRTAAGRRLEATAANSAAVGTTSVGGTSTTASAGPSSVGAVASVASLVGSGTGQRILRAGLTLDGVPAKKLMLQYAQFTPAAGAREIAPLDGSAAQIDPLVPSELSVALPVGDGTWLLKLVAEKQPDDKQEEGPCVVIYLSDDGQQPLDRRMQLATTTAHLSREFVDKHLLDVDYDKLTYRVDDFTWVATQVVASSRVTGPVVHHVVPLGPVDLRHFESWCLPSEWPVLHRGLEAQSGRTLEIR